MMPMEDPGRPYLVVQSGIGGEMSCFIRSVADRQVSCRRSDVFRRSLACSVVHASRDL
jgi:hypothetical protein